MAWCSRLDDFGDLGGYVGRWCVVIDPYFYSAAAIRAVRPEVQNMNAAVVIGSAYKVAVTGVALVLDLNGYALFWICELHVLGSVIA